jgi:hypothetical protein
MVTPDLRETVAAAFASAGLSFEWRAMRGDPTGIDAPIAPARLEVVVSTLDVICPRDLVSSLSAELAGALASVRRDVPALPFGIHSLTGSGSMRFAFRPAATPESVVEGLERIDSADPSTGVVGWDEQGRKWLPL